MRANVPVGILILPQLPIFGPFGTGTPMLIVDEGLLPCGRAFINERSFLLRNLLPKFVIAGARFFFQSESHFWQTLEQCKEKKKETRINKYSLAYFGILKPVWTPGVRPRVGLLLALHRCQHLVPTCWLAAYPHGSRRRYCQVLEAANVEARKRIRLRAEAWFLASLDDACLHALADPWPESSGFLWLCAQAFPALR